MWAPPSPPLANRRPNATRPIPTLSIPTQLNATFNPLPPFMFEGGVSQRTRQLSVHRGVAQGAVLVAPAGSRVRLRGSTKPTGVVRWLVDGVGAKAVERCPPVHRAGSGCFCCCGGCCGRGKGGGRRASVHDAGGSFHPFPALKMPF